MKGLLNIARLRSALDFALCSWRTFYTALCAGCSGYIYMVCDAHIHVAGVPQLEGFLTAREKHSYDGKQNTK